MINLRYHVFSLIAVFAALAIGIVVGSTTVRSGLVDNLRGNVRRAEERIAEVETRNDELTRRARQLDLLETDGVQLVSGAAPLVPVLWVTAPGLDDEVWKGVEQMARSAGVVTIGRLVLDRDVFDDDQVDLLATALDSQSRDPSRLRAELGSVLAERIDRALDIIEVGVSADQPAETPTDASTPTTRPPRRTTTTIAQIGPDSDVALSVAFGDLEDKGVVDLRELGAGGVTVGSVAQVVVLDDLRSGIDAADVLLTLVDDLTRTIDRLVILSEARNTTRAEGDPDSVVAQVRDSGRLSDELSTVDNLEDAPGWMATVLALRNALVGDLGHFGYRDGSDHLLPEPVS